MRSTLLGRSENKSGAGFPVLLLARRAKWILSRSGRRDSVYIIFIMTNSSNQVMHNGDTSYLVNRTWGVQLKSDRKQLILKHRSRLNFMPFLTVIRPID